mmetsp:Transcript_56442/g.175099  ORF Transcript_56442/g.175099 Transcript_56442/m.175099 type:complete len:329 (+) Transcript_56442:504-1490(+)
MQQVCLVCGVANLAVRAARAQALAGHGLRDQELVLYARAVFVQVQQRPSALRKLVPERRMFAAEALHRHEAVGQRSAVGSVARGLLLEGRVQDALHPAELLLRPGDELVAKRSTTTFRGHPVLGRLQRRPAQRLHIARGHEDRAPTRLVPEHHLHLACRDAVDVLVCAASVAKGPIHVVAVAHDQVPLAQVIHHEVADAHGPLAHVALAIHVAIPSALLVPLGGLQAELVAHVASVAVRHPALHLASHLLPDECVQMLIDSVRVRPADFDESIPGRRLVRVGIGAELDHQQGLLCLLRPLGVGELHLLLADDIVDMTGWVGHEAPSIA